MTRTTGESDAASAHEAGFQKELQYVGEALRELRMASEVTQEDIAVQAGLDAGTVAAVEQGEGNPAFSTISRILQTLDIGWGEFGGLLAKTMRAGGSVYELHPIALPGVSQEAGQLVENFMVPLINDRKKKAREAIAESYLYALKLCPEENASDLWHHVLYRIYRAKKEGTNPEQSWVRASGEAFEIVLAEQYNPRLEPHGLRLRTLFSGIKKAEVLRRMEIADLVGSSKVDIVIEQENGGRGQEGGWGLTGGIHAKVSLAERVSDDVPASRIMMERGLQSILVTLDVKSFPPPHGDWVNRGELGSPEEPSDKRQYIESHGEFTACISYNTRTIPSGETTPSGRKIFLGDLRNGEDPLIEVLRSHEV